MNRKDKRKKEERIWNVLFDWWMTQRICTKFSCLTNGVKNKKMIKIMNFDRIEQRRIEPAMELV